MEVLGMDNPAIDTEKVIDLLSQYRIPAIDTDKVINEVNTAILS